MRWLILLLSILGTLVGAGAAEAAPYAVPCRANTAFVEASRANAASIDTLVWTPFGATETGWEAYAPALAREIGTRCDAFTPDFAASLAAWQARYGLPASGVFDAPTFEVLKGVMQERRPFMMARLRKECPDPPSGAYLALIPREEESAQRENRMLRADVLASYRAMVQAARAEVPEIAADVEQLKIFSGFRAPEADDARCAQEMNCDGVRRAGCSAHRTGTAVDLFMGRMGDLPIDGTGAENRLFMSRTTTYRWLIQNAGRFGFVNYLYEPWHWEWVGSQSPDFSTPRTSN